MEWECGDLTELAQDRVKCPAVASRVSNYGAVYSSVTGSCSERRCSMQRSHSSLRHTAVLSLCSKHSDGQSAVRVPLRATQFSKTYRQAVGPIQEPGFLCGNKGAAA